MMCSHDRDHLETEVVFHSGYKGREEPRLIRRRGKEFSIVRILNRGRREDIKGGGRIDYFICFLENGRRVLIESSEKNGETVRFLQPGR